MRLLYMTYLIRILRDFGAAIIARLQILSPRRHKTASTEQGYVPTGTNFRRLSDVNTKSTPNGAARVMLDRAISVPELPFSAPVYAIGDVHGRADLLHALLDVIAQDCKTTTERPHLVFLGDYIDRGFQSQQVINTLIGLDRDDAFETVFLKGNHEQAMLHFLKDHRIGPDWAAFGGRETLISYGIAPPKSVNALDQWEPIQKELVETISEEHTAFLEALPVSHKIGPYGFVHAGVKPGIPYDDQSDEDRLWIREEFLNAKDKEDLYIVHGHTPVNAPYSDHRRVNVDTGAYFTGRLTAVKILGDKMSFLTNQLRAQESEE